MAQGVGGLAAKMAYIALKMGLIVKTVLQSNVGQGFVRTGAVQQIPDGAAAAQLAAVVAQALAIGCLKTPCQLAFASMVMAA